MTIQANNKPFRHFGIYGRLNTDGSPITAFEAALDNRVVRALFRRGTTTRSRLHQAVGSSNPIVDVQRSIERLQNWGLVDVTSFYKHFEISLTQSGKAWGLELVGKEQIDTANAAEDEKRERARTAARAALNEPQE